MIVVVVKIPPIHRWVRLSPCRWKKNTALQERGGFMINPFAGLNISGAGLPFILPVLTLGKSLLTLRKIKRYGG
jgi:hypothetical protein